jgi:class 3 adenylate cyclase
MRLPGLDKLIPAAMILAVSAILAMGTTRVLALMGALENRVTDLRLLNAPPEPQHPDLVIVAINEATMARLPYRSPMDRGFLAQLVAAIDAAGARAIGLDLLFDQPTEPQKDALLRSVLLSAKAPVVAAWADAGEHMTKSQVAYLTAFLEGIRKGFPNLVTNRADGIVRSVYPGRRGASGFVPGLAVALAESVGAEVPRRTVPLAYRGRTVDDKPPFRMIPSHGILVKATERFHKNWFAGKVVLVGGDRPHDDRHMTPRGLRPGIEIHAHAVAQFLDGRTAPTVGLGLEALVVIAMAVIGLTMARMDTSILAKVSGGVAVLALLWGLGFLVVQQGGPPVPLMTPTLSLGFASGIGSVYLGHAERRQRRYIRQAFSRFVDPSVVKELVADPSKLSLGGERREVTYVFTDIAGFTSLTERTEPAVLVPMINEYLDGMCRIVFEHGGTLDKIVGDAVVCLFGAPADQPDHAERAVRCALALDRFACDFAATKQAAGIDFGGTRIGLHTGLAVVGNFGGDAFFDYTGHGDTVNTAARMEGVNKYLGTRICVSGATAERCLDVAFRPVGNLVLKGKDEGTPAFEPLSEDDAESPETRAYRDAFDRMERGDPGARPAFAELARTTPRDSLVALHASRLEAGETGTTIVMKEK